MAHIAHGVPDMSCVHGDSWSTCYLVLQSSMMNGLGRESVTFPETNISYTALELLLYQYILKLFLWP